MRSLIAQVRTLRCRTVALVSPLAALAGACSGAEPEPCDPAEAECDDGARPSVKPPALKPTQVGRHCEQDSECGAGRCLTSRDDTLLGGGAGANVCVIECTSDAALCDGYSRELVCVQTAGAATQSNADDRSYCFESCEVGDERSAKCSGRTQLACDTSFEGSAELDAAFCRPLCFEDADCDLGECDLGRGVCTPTGRDGQALGALCGPELGSCSGLCLEEAGIQYCSQR
ncbi:MAG: hypothetical protein RJA70_210, partial [Pseudomonadota bacterium]